jgi:hypothetical protein
MLGHDGVVPKRKNNKKRSVAVKHLSSDTYFHCYFYFHAAGSANEQMTINQPIYNQSFKAAYCKSQFWECCVTFSTGNTV